MSVNIIEWLIHNNAPSYNMERGKKERDIDWKNKERRQRKI
jgi:hypothetical protein